MLEPGRPAWEAGRGFSLLRGLGEKLVDFPVLRGARLLPGQHSGEGHTCQRVQSQELMRVRHALGSGCLLTALVPLPCLCFQNQAVE